MLGGADSLPDTITALMYQYGVEAVVSPSAKQKQFITTIMLMALGK